MSEIQQRLATGKGKFMQPRIPDSGAAFFDMVSEPAV
jgi:hypothetical protein